MNAIARRVRRAAPLCLLLAAAGCVTRPYDASLVPEPGRAISLAQIENSPGANAWDVLRFSGLPISFQPGALFGESRMVRRGSGSILLSEEPILVVDGIRMSGMEALREIPKSHLQSIRLLSAIDSGIRYGAGTRGGAVVVETRRQR